MSKFYNLSDDAIEKFNDVFKKKAFPVDVRFQFVGIESQKSLIKISKIADQFAFILDKELLVSINEDLMNVFDEESIQILIEQEIDKVSINIETGKIKLVKPDLTTFSSLINKYGIEKISRANQVELLASEQKQDAEDEFIL
jgi:Putative phage metallopeptidase